MQRYQEAAAAFGNYVNLLPDRDRGDRALWVRETIRFLRVVRRAPAARLRDQPEDRAWTVPVRVRGRQGVRARKVNGVDAPSSCWTPAPSRRSISREVARRSGVTPITYTESAGVGDIGFRGLQIGRIDTLEIGGMKVRHVPALIKNPPLGAMPGREPESFSPLALGLSMRLDYRQRQLTMSRRLPAAALHHGAAAADAAPGDRARHGQRSLPASFVVDTGGEVISISGATADLMVPPNPYRRIPLKVYGTSGWDKEAFLMPFVDLEFSSLRFSRIPVVVLNLRAPSALLGYQLGGIVGHRFLSRYRVTIDLDRCILGLEAAESAAADADTTTGSGWLLPRGSLRSTERSIALDEQGTHKEQPAMLYGAIDLHLRYSEIRVIDADGRVVREKRVVTSRETLTAAFAGLGEVRVLLETGTESEWVAQALEAAGHAVVVADPNYAPMYGELHRRVKTRSARRGGAGGGESAGLVSGDASAVGGAAAGAADPAEPAAAGGDADGHDLGAAGAAAARGVSAAVGEQRAGRRRGWRGSRCPRRWPLTLAPLRQVIETLTRELAAIDARLAPIAAADPVVTRLQTVPGVGPVVALTFRATLDDVARFAAAGQVSAFLGLVPREDSSAERRHRGHITKAGSGELRSLLVQAAWACWKSKGSGTLRAVGRAARGAAGPPHCGGRRWRGASVAFCMRCGATGRRLTSRAWRRPRRRPGRR